MISFLIGITFRGVTVKYFEEVLTRIRIFSRLTIFQEPPSPPQPRHTTITPAVELLFSFFTFFIQYYYLLHLLETFFIFAFIVTMALSIYSFYRLPNIPSSCLQSNRHWHSGLKNTDKKNRIYRATFWKIHHVYE